MKALKVNHDLAQAILKGRVRITWRLYDDKDLTVNDFVRIVDKVHLDRPSTWKVIGIAQIKKIVEKPLGDIEPSENEDHSKTTAQVLRTMRSYYGPDVSATTSVKIIYFDFIPKKEADNSNVNKKTTLKEIKLFADGGSRGNPGPSASGFVILDMNDQIVVKKGVYLGVTTSNQAEYQAIKLGLEEAVKMQAKTVHVFLDSLLVVNQMLGVFKVKSRDLWPVYSSVKELSGKFEKIIFTHVPREFNKLADKAVNDTLDRALR